MTIKRCKTNFNPKIKDNERQKKKAEKRETDKTLED